MSKTIPAGLAAVYASGAATLAIGLRLQRADGLVLGFTSADRADTISGVAYSPSRAINASNIVSSDGLTVDNLEMTTTDWEDTFTRADVLAGRWTGATFLLFRYSWADSSAGVEPLLAGVVGHMRPERGALVTELRGLQQYLQQPVGNVTSKTCRARFADYPAPMGNNRCRLSAGAWTDSLVVTAVTSRRSFTAIPAGATGGDPYWASVAMLLRGGGADGSTTITDSSTAARSVSVVGNARVRTAQSKWGGSSLYVDGTGDCFLVADSPNITLPGDFTFEAWVYVAADTGSNQAIAYLPGAGWELYRRTSSGNALVLYNGTNVIIGATAITTGAWHYVAWTRGGGVHRIYLDGALQGSFSSSATVDPTSIILGAYNTAGTSEPMNGYLDDVRLTVGVARDGSVVPTAAFPDFYGAAVPARPSDWYAEGVVTWTAGGSLGMASKVKAFTSGGLFELSTDLPADIQVGDTLQALAGCRKRLAADCRDRFNNVVNFCGEPHLPGYDALTQTPDTQA